jgi:hypothetical protein
LLYLYLTRFNGFSHLSVEIDFGAGQSVRRNSPSGILFQRNSLNSQLIPS